MTFDSRPKEEVIKEIVGEITSELDALTEERADLEKAKAELKKQLDKIEKKIKAVCTHPKSYVTVYSQKRENDRMFYWEYRLECELCNSTVKKWHN